MKRPHTPRSPREAGFTLLELMLTVGLVAIVTGIISQVVYMENKSMVGQLARAEAQQNARATISLLQRYARVAGWGIHTDLLAGGVVPFGACFDDADTKQQQLDCDNLDPDREGLNRAAYPHGTDRLRVLSVRAQGGGALLRQAMTAVGGADLPANLDTLPVHPDHPLFTGGGDVAAIVSGPCTGGGFAADLINLTASNGAVPPARFTYAFTNLETGAQDYTCAAGYEAPLSMGAATVADFWIDRATDPDHPTLMMRLDPNLPLASGYAVAYDIDDLQVRFMLDVTCDENLLTAEVECPPPDAGVVGDSIDHVWDVLCDSLDPARVDAEGGCNGDLDAVRAGLSVMTQAERFNRVIGAQIAIVARTRDQELREGVTPAMWLAAASDLIVHNHQFKGRGDGYDRWIYRATVALRNRE